MPIRPFREKLEEPASQLYQHTLTQALESAERASVAGDDPAYVLDCVDARCLQVCMHGSVLSGRACHVRIAYAVSSPTRGSFPHVCDQE